MSLRSNPGLKIANACGVKEIANACGVIGSPAISHDNRTIYFTYSRPRMDIWLMNVANDE